MRKSFLVVCSCSWLAFTGSAMANPICLDAVDATDATAQSMGLSICRVYAQFSNSGDLLLSVAYSDISTTDPAGFWQHAIGGDTAPLILLCDLFPDVCYDSFVTTNLAVVPLGAGDSTSLDGDWNSVSFNNAGQTAGGWYNSNPGNDQGTPDENNQVLIGQFAVNAGYDISGALTMFFNDGSAGLPFAFDCFAPPECSSDAECDDGIPCTVDTCLDCGCVHSSCGGESAQALGVIIGCAPDLTGDDVVNAADLAQLLGGWGPNPGHPADFNSDGVVEAADLALLLGSWGPCPGGDCPAQQEVVLTSTLR